MGNGGIEVTHAGQASCLSGRAKPALPLRRTRENTPFIRGSWQSMPLRAHYEPIFPEQKAELTATATKTVRNESFLRKQESRALSAVVHRRWCGDGFLARQMPAKPLMATSPVRRLFEPGPRGRRLLRRAQSPAFAWQAAWRHATQTARRSSRGRSRRPAAARALRGGRRTERSRPSTPSAGPTGPRARAP